MLTDGSIKTAKELFEEISINGEIFQGNEEQTVFTPKEKIEVFSLNKSTGKIEKKEIQHAWRLLGGKTIKIKLRNGFEIETTPEHKYIIFKDGEFDEIEAKDLKLGDRVVSSRKLNVNSNIKMKEEILEKLSKENFYINLSDELHDLLKKEIFEYGIEKLTKELGVSIKAKSFYHGLWQNRYNLNDFIKICRLFNLNLEEVYNNIDFIFYRTEKQRGQNSLKIKLPENFEEFFYLAGLFLGDGSGKKFIVGKEELGNKLIGICNKIEI
jgi:intein/homing endonuclease